MLGAEGPWGLAQCAPVVQPADFNEVELVSPRLSLFLNDCLRGYELNGGARPSLRIKEVGVARR